MKNHGIELSKLVTLQRLRMRRKAIPTALIDRSIASEKGKLLARVIAGVPGAIEQLSDQDREFIAQIRALAGDVDA